MESRAIPSGVPIQIDSEPVELPGGLKGYPAEIVLSTGNVCYNRSQMGGWFVIDLESVIVAKDKLTGTYDHDTGEVVGRSESWEVTDAGLVLHTFIIPFDEKDRACEILARGRAQTQYEASPDIATERAIVEKLIEGETAVVNGREITVPEGGKELRIYRNLPVLAYAICPIATDGGTNVTILKAEEHMADDELKDPTEETTTETGEEGGGGSQYNAFPDLEAMIEKYGLEHGVEFYRRGLSIDDAKDEFIKIVQDENEQLKGAPQKLNEEDPPKTEEGDGGSSATPESEDEIKKLKAEVSRLSASNTRLSAEFAKLKRGRGETEPLSMSGETPDTKTKPMGIGDTVNYYNRQAANARKRQA